MLSLLTAVLGALAALAVPRPAYAYTGSDAASYADYWWNGHNPNYMSFSDDCTNFVSQSLHEGGHFSYVGGSSTDDNQWWVHPPSVGPNGVL